MDQILVFVVGAGLGGLLLALAWQLGRDATLRRMRRAAFFDQTAGMIFPFGSALMPTGFPRVSGQIRGLTIDLQAVPDTLTYRKLPCLWVLVTIVAPQPVQASFDLMIRPTGIELFSNFATLPFQVTPPGGFPADCALRTDDPQLMPPADLIQRHLAIFDDPRMKELVISPRGLRLVLLAEQADRGRYLIFRDAEMGRVPFSFADLQLLLVALQALHNDLAATKLQATA